MTLAFAEPPKNRLPTKYLTVFISMHNRLEMLKTSSAMWNVTTAVKLDEVMAARQHLFLQRSFLAT